LAPQNSTLTLFVHVFCYRNRSTKIKCPFCDAVSNSIVEYRPSLLGYLLTMLSLLIFGFFALILMPFLVSLTKSAIHRCAKCLNEVQNNSYFGFSSLEDKVCTSPLISFKLELRGAFSDDEILFKQPSFGAEPMMLIYKVTLT